MGGGGLLCDQLWYNALQRCFAIWPQPAAVGGPFLTDGRTNLLISPTIAEAGWMRGVGGVCLVVYMRNQIARLDAR